jgi:hypothetical protein
MASALIHAAVCNKLNKELKRDTKSILLGTIAPDISKLVGETKLYSHFLDNEEDGIPNLSRFLERYSKYLDDDFVLGYYIHLYTDYLWFKYFIPEIYNEEKNMIRKLDGTIINCHGHMAELYIYNDYTNINDNVIKNYKIDLGFLYDKKPVLKDIIKEAHMDKIDILINKVKEIYEKSKERKEYVFDMDNIDNFIKLAVKLIEADLRDLKVIN